MTANSTLPLRRPVLPSSTRPSSSSLDTALPQQKIGHLYNDNINSKRTSNIYNKMPYRPTSTITTATTATGMSTTTTKLPRRGTFMSSTAIPRTKAAATQISPKLGKRQLSATNDEHFYFNKYQKIPIINEHKLSRTSSSLHHHTTTTTTKSTFAERQQRSPSINSNSSSVITTTNYPIHYDDKVANLYAQYMQWQLITLDADESTDRRKIEEEVCFVGGGLD